MPRYILLVAALASVALLAVGCKNSSSSSPVAGAIASASANPTLQADKAKAEAKATTAVNKCLPPGAKPAATALASLEQPTVIDALIHHSGRKAFEGCLKAQGTKLSASCMLSQVAQAPSDLASRSGRDALAQAIYVSCLLPAVK